jgi:hypothetical protein
MNNKKAFFRGKIVRLYLTLEVTEIYDTEREIQTHNPLREIH